MTSGAVEAVAWMYVRPEDEHTEFFCDRWPELVGKGFVETPLYTRATPSDQEKGYKDAFYQLSDLMDISAQPRSPKEVWEAEMLPRLRAALAPSDQEALISELREALGWYGEQARLARLIHSEGDAGRHALADDGGKRAEALLTRTEGART